MKMELFTRVKICSLLAVLVLLTAGLAWAGEADVVSAVNAYGLTAAGNGSGTITVTGSVSKPANEVLIIGDITGLTIDWKADLTVTSGATLPQEYGMINFTNGSLKMTGGTIQLPASASPAQLNGIYARGAATVTLDGGRITGGSGASIVGIIAENDGGKVIINSGEINIPKAVLILADSLTVNNPNALTGIAILAPTRTVTVYKYAATDGSWLLGDDDDDDDDDDDGVATSYVVQTGATWDIEGVSATGWPAGCNLTVESGGTLNLKKTSWRAPKGTYYQKPGSTVNIDSESKLEWEKINIEDKVITTGGLSLLAAGDPGTLNNKGALTIPAGGSLTNKGVVNNTGTMTNKGSINNKGTIVSEGKIDNSGGTIDNEGTFQSSQSKDEMGGAVNGQVQPTGGGGDGNGGDGNSSGGDGSGGDGNSSGGDGSGGSSNGIPGCNAGFVVFGLLPLAVFAARKRMMR